MILTYKFRIKDSSHRAKLARLARSVNLVWNYCCETQRKAQDYRRAGLNRRWPAEFDLNRLMAGVAADIGLHSDTVAQVSRRFTKSRDQHRRCPRFRASRGPRRALGWIPFIPRAGKIDGDAFVYLKRRYRFWKSRQIEGEFKCGAFVQDARGRWYLTFQCEVDDVRPTGSGVVGVDLGLKAVATCSNGYIIPALQHYRRNEAALARAQRARNAQRVRAINAKIANTRLHHLHVESSHIARENRIIVVGNVSAAKLQKTKMAKSVSDAGWHMLKTFLRYKASRHGATFIEVDERWTSQTCSCCGMIPDSSPKGIGALGIRHWQCDECGASHNRDVNAAQNILRVGLECQPPAEEIAD